MKLDRHRKAILLYLLIEVESRKVVTGGRMENWEMLNRKNKEEKCV